MKDELFKEEFNKQFSEEFQSGLEKNLEIDADKLFAVLTKRVYMETMEILGEGDRSEYKKMIEGGESAEKVEDFLNERIADYPQFLEQVVSQFREEMINLNKN